MLIILKKYGLREAWKICCLLLKRVRIMKVHFPSVASRCGVSFIPEMCCTVCGVGRKTTHFLLQSVCFVECCVYAMSTSSINSGSVIFYSACAHQ